MKKNKKFLIPTLIVLAVCLYVAVPLLYDRWVYSSQDKKIKGYISSLKVAQGNVKAEKYCTYSHQKYSKGTLKCDVRYSFSYKNDSTLFDKSTTTAQEFGWKFKWDNAVTNNKYSTEKFIKSEVYEYRHLLCSFVIIEKSDAYEYQLGCSGRAKAEWYPVRNE